MSKSRTAPQIDRHLARHTLTNGLRIVLHRDVRHPLVTVNLWYHVGSKNEAPGRTGFAHLFEHLLFQGSQHVDTTGHFRYVQQVGGSANGSTWYDRTNYYETLPAHHLERGLWLESDRMGFFLEAIDHQKLETQRDVVMNERRQRVDNQPYGRASERQSELLYAEGHPYSWPVIGYMDDIAAATLEEVRAFFSTYYVPNNAVLTLAGDFEEDEALASIERWFGAIPRGAPIERPVIPSPRPAGQRRDTLEDDVRLPRVYMAFETPAVGTDSWYAADLLTTLLTQGKSSRLHRDLVYERRLAQDVYAYVLPTEESAVFAVVSTAKPGVDPARLEAAIREHLDALAAEAPEAAAFERARRVRLTSHFGEMQRIGDRADQLALFTTYFDDPHAAFDEASRYERLDGEDLQRFAATYLQAEQSAVVTVVPRTGSGTSTSSTGEVTS